MKNQTSKSPNSEGTPKKMGRPRGRKSDPSYRQVTIYLPTELHNRARQMVGNSQLSADKAQRQDFSGLVEVLLREYFQTSEIPQQSQELLEMSNGLREQSAKIAAMSEEEFAEHLQKMKGSQDDVDIKPIENEREIAEFEKWAAQGLITTADFHKLVRLTTWTGELTPKECDWLIAMRKRVRSKIAGQKKPAE